jgi:hypothetical protein
MEIESRVEVLEKNDARQDKTLADLITASQNLVISSTKHEEQLDIIRKIVYGACACVLLGVGGSILALVAKK